MKTRTVTISKTDIFFDVNAATHIFAKVNDGKDPRRFDALESDTGDTFNNSVVTRLADRRAAELRERLARFLKAPSSAVSSATAGMSSATGYEFVFQVEDGFQDELMEPLAHAMEEYMANGAIAAWYAEAGDAMAASYQQTLEPTLARVLSYLVERKFPTRS